MTYHQSLQVEMFQSLTGRSFCVAQMGIKANSSRHPLTTFNCTIFLCLTIILSIIHCVFPASSQMRISVIPQYQFRTRTALICALKHMGIPLEKIANDHLILTLTQEVKRRLQRVLGWCFHNINGSWLYTLMICLAGVFFSLSNTLYLLLTVTSVSL